MLKRKLQIFVSSTYEDLIDYRLAAMEAILAAGHIPAAMEQFSPGDETAWQKITRWIDESDAFILILGGRYGSIEPSSGRSYVELEYDYALEKGKPFFALVIDEKHHEKRVSEHGFKVDERKNRKEYDALREKVAKHLCRFWKKKEDIESAIFQKLPEWAQREDLKGWVRGEEAQDPQVTAELARLSQENSQLREQVEQQASAGDYNGVTFQEMVHLLRQQRFSTPDGFLGLDREERGFDCEHAGHILEVVILLRSGSYSPVALDRKEQHAILYLKQLDLVEGGRHTLSTRLTETGRRLWMRLSLVGELPERLATIWKTEPQEDENS